MRKSIRRIEREDIPSASNRNHSGRPLGCQVVLTDVAAPNSNVKYLQMLCGNGADNNIYRCRSKRCHFQNDFAPRDKVVSTCTTRFYDCIIPNSSVYVNCHSANVVYLITCSKCSMQYVGETVQRLNERFTDHRQGIKNPEKYGFCKILSNHFHSGSCKGSTYNVQILEKLEGNGRTKRGAIDPAQTALRKKCEKKWIMKLRSLYPHGLNDRLGDEFITNETHHAVFSKFPPLQRSRLRIGRGITRKGNNPMSAEIFMKNFKKKITTDLHNSLNFIRITLSCMKKSQLKKVGDLLNDEILIHPDGYQFSQWFIAALDIVESKIYKHPPTKKAKLNAKNVCKVYFPNKAMDMINLSYIFKNSDLLKTIPSYVGDFEPPTVVYDLSPNIGSKIFNFNKFVSELDVDNFLTDEHSIPCSCNKSNFKDAYHKHIISGDLNLIRDKKLKDLFGKGPKFRESAGINWDDAKKAISNGINDYTKKWCGKHKRNPEELEEWKVTVMKLVTERIEQLKTKVNCNMYHNTLSNKDSAAELQRLQKQFVITPIDKASGNVAFICRRFYAEVLVRELGLREGYSNNTYTNISQNSNEIIGEHVTRLQNEYKLSVGNNNQSLPHIYWLPKLHKNPSKFRFIIAAPKCSIKPLSKDITSILKLFYKQIETYNQKCQFYSGVKTFWILQNNVPVINSLKNISARNKARSMCTFDFSTLYTKIPHDKLIDVLCELTDFCFQGGTYKYIAVNSFGARWVGKVGKGQNVYDKNKVKHALKYLLNNCFFSLGGKLFRQIIGIPMGSDPAPYMANLFLYYYESKWTRKLKKSNLHKARQLTNIFRFIDDLITINDGGEFERNYKEIYPPELELNLEHSGDHASFLDLDINLQNNKFIFGLFDKRDGFPFSIVRMPYSSSNIPRKIFYSAIGAEILRVSRTTSDFNSFTSSCNTLLERSFKQGAKKDLVIKELNKVFGRHTELSVFANTSQDFINLFF